MKNDKTDLEKSQIDCEMETSRINYWIRYHRRLSNLESKLDRLESKGISYSGMIRKDGFSLSGKVTGRRLRAEAIIERYKDGISHVSPNVRFEKV